ncbi:MAG: hypothetical protein QXM86_03335 [Candidatus Bathyarchaeia archaeon]
MKSKPQCKICGKTKDLIKHHLTKPLVRFKLSEKNNGEYVVLCRNCHVLLHNIFWDKNNSQRLKDLPVEISKINKPYIDSAFLKTLVSQGYNTNIDLSELAYYWALWYYTWIETNPYIPSGRTLRILKTTRNKS